MTGRWRLALVILMAAGVARADNKAPKAGGVAWRDEWPRFSPWEGALTLGATVGVYIAERRAPEPESANITFEVPIVDSGPRFLLRGRDEKVQRVFGTYSDLGFRMMAFFPYVVDAGAAALVAHRNPDVAAQLALIDLQALTLSGATQLLMSRFVARERPYVQDCVNGETFNRACGGPNDNKSFYSGHSTGAFTSAGLVCVHHEHLPLFGGGPVERWACGWAVGIATITAVSRIVHDVHYFSDVLVGAGIGWFYGYAMPQLLHFRHGARSGEGSSAAGLARWLRVAAPSFVAMPGDGGMLSVSGLF